VALCSTALFDGMGCVKGKIAEHAVSKRLNMSIRIIVANLTCRMRNVIIRKAGSGKNAAGRKKRDA
jgi:hypothetical protein